MRTADGRAQWISTMVSAISQTGAQYFRVHDSGDMFSTAYAQCWLEVCRRMADVSFWIPTRAWQQPSSPLPVFDPLLNTLRKLAALPNVTVRPSALNFGALPPAVTGLHAGSTAAFSDSAWVKECPAPNQGGHCGGCRTCWDAKAVPVTYRRH
jgi:hypothetical protein